MNVHAVVGGAGAGSTTTALNLAVALRKAGHHAAVLDARGDVAGVLGLAVETTLADVLAGRASVREAIVEHDLAAGDVPVEEARHYREDLVSDPTDFRAGAETAPEPTPTPADMPDVDVLPVVAGWPAAGEDATGGVGDADPGAVQEVLYDLAMAYDYVVVDADGAVDAFEHAADGLLVVTTPADDHLGAAAALVERDPGRVVGLVVNRAGEAISVRSLADRAGADVVGVVPADERTPGLEPVAFTMADVPVATAYERLAGKVADWDGVPAAHADPADVAAGDERDGDDEDDGGLLGRLTRRF